MPASFELATLYVTLSQRGAINLTPAQEQLKKTVDLSERLFKQQAQVAYQASPAGQRMLRDAAEMEAALKKLEAQNAWQKQVAQQGLVSASLAKIKTQLGEIQTVGAIAFGTLSAGITGFVAAASPEIFGTLTGSLQLVSGELGSAFLPEILKASQWLQQLADDIRNLDPATKSQIASWALWGTAIAGTVVFLPRILSLLSMLHAPIHLLDRALVIAAGSMRTFQAAQTASFMGLPAYAHGASMTATAMGRLSTVTTGAAAAMKAFALANPVTTILAIGTALYALITAFQRSASSADELRSHLDELERDAESLGEGGRLSQRMYERDISLGLRQEIERTTAGPQRDALLRRRIEEARQAQAGQREMESVIHNVEAALPFVAGQTNQDRRAFIQSELGLNGNLIPVQRAQRQEAMARLPELSGEITPQLMQQIRVALRGAGTEMSARLHALEDVLTHGVPGAGGSGFAMRRPQVQGGAFNTIEGAWRRMQEAAFRDPLEQKKLEQQVRNYEAALRQADAADRLSGRLDEWLQRWMGDPPAGQNWRDAARDH